VALIEDRHECAGAVLGPTARGRHEAEGSRERAGLVDHAGKVNPHPAGGDGHGLPLQVLVDDSSRRPLRAGQFRASRDAADHHHTSCTPPRILGERERETCAATRIEARCWNPRQVCLILLAPASLNAPSPRCQPDKNNTGYDRPRDRATRPTTSTPSAKQALAPRVSRQATLDGIVDPRRRLSRVRGGTSGLKQPNGRAGG